jgi:carbamoylphosphate synthase small subunit
MRSLHSSEARPDEGPTLLLCFTLIFCTLPSQEVMTDPSYKDQFVCFTCPHIGNVGINPGACIQVFLCACINPEVSHTPLHAYTRTHTHTHIHTHTHRCIHKNLRTRTFT